MFSGFGGFNDGFGEFMGQMHQSSTFEDYFRCYPIVMMPDSTRKDDANFGGKVFLPASALNKLTRLNISYPMLFQLTNENNGLISHSGVLEFTAEEGRIYVPQWIMSTLKLEPGELIKLNSCDLPKGKFVKIEPQSVNFLDISDPKAVLENVLRKFTTLTVDDIIEVNYNDTIYEIKILEAKPETVNHGICVVETDLETDFAPPVGYVEPDYKNKAPEKYQKNQSTKREWKPVNNYGAMAKALNYAEMMKPDTTASSSFQGHGARLSGKTIADGDNDNAEPIDVTKLSLDGPVKPLRLPENQLFFGFPLTPPPESEEKKSGESNKEEGEEDTDKHGFAGAGKSLREATKKRKSTRGHSTHKAKVRSPGSSPSDPMEID
ncbi:polyubiquitin-binding protein [Saccharomycopsis crataegensis]|uniref:Ubiquitin fusion degradation protein 1 n=1 Tax=Saccharomycopsis crataegensis TaxID=43959 RepID=A0AAV5QTC3_9ASCO|nr:polyubiquitin-binding protein [Saccharomycopsis crataegensis]